MTVDKILKYAGIVVSLSSAIMLKYNILLAFALFFAGMVLYKFASAIKSNRDMILFHYGENRG